MVNRNTLLVVSLFLVGFISPGLLEWYSPVRAQAPQGGKTPSAQEVPQTATAPKSAEQETPPPAPAYLRNPNGQKDSKEVNFTADLMRPVKIGDSSALSLVGHVVFYHNGAIITCDSAIRYNDKMMDCYNNVIINKDSTYIYGQRANYNGHTNIAEVQDRIVKMIDKDAVFYTYNLMFNTLTNVGYYTGGGTMVQKDNRMESMRGYYYMDTRDLVGVDQVEITNSDYEMRSDSVTYNMDTEIASFSSRSYIWNSKGEILTAKKGSFNRKTNRYNFTDESYILTKSQELWADTMIYEQGDQNAEFHKNVQVIENEQRSLAFGDYAHYWGKEKRMLLTDNPSVLSYDERKSADSTRIEPERDTLFVRSDTIFIYTFNRKDSLAGDSIRIDSLNNLEAPSLINAVDDRVEQMEETIRQAEAEMPSNVEEGFEALSEQTAIEQTANEPGSEAQANHNSEELTGGVLEEAPPAPSEKELKRLRAEAKQAEKIARRKEKIEARLDQQKEKLVVSDSLALKDSLRLDSLRLDSLSKVELAGKLDSLQKAKGGLDSLPPADSIGPKQVPDSLVRQLHAFHNVRIYRSDMQAVCDSLVGFTLDSTMHMYTKPVLWNDNNQVTAQVIDIYSKNKKLERAKFVGEPIMSSEVDTVHYNQIKGKEIIAYFSDGSISRMDAIGNGQTYYYMMDGEEPDQYINGFMTVESADISFYFKEKKLDQITWRGEPAYVIYPTDKFPAEESQHLPGFTWEIERRPTRDQVFYDRTIRPSQREDFESMPKPNYPISERIKEQREELVKRGIWYDREDEVSREAMEFIRTIR